MIDLLISDFDGTLADTFLANYNAYKAALSRVDIYLSEDRYRQFFGLRFDDFMSRIGIYDSRVREKIRNDKSEYYIQFFGLLKINRPLLEFIRCHHSSGGFTAIASTARRRNLIAALQHIGAINDFDLILAGDSASKGKPDPEIYNKVLRHFSISPDKALAFEDSSAGIMAAEAAGINVIQITNEFFQQQSKG